MRFGVNLLLFGDKVTPSVLRLFPQLRALGADGVEVPVFAPRIVDYAAIRTAAQKAGLAITVSGALPGGCSWYARESAQRQKAERYLRGCIKVAVELGAPVICGPLYKTVGDMDESIPLGKQRLQCARAMREIGQEASEAGVVLALEPLNRFETNLLNTTSQGIAFCQVSGKAGIGLLLDTFHMHIEEQDSARAVKAAARAGVLAHFHASENDRGIAGTGQVRWHEVATALKTARYGGWVTIESFSQSVKAIRRAASCWRPFFPSEKEFVERGLRFTRNVFGMPFERSRD